jgi:hypothetical protein
MDQDHLGSPGTTRRLATIAAQQRELDQLKHYVERLLRDRYGPHSEKLDPNQLLLFENQPEEPVTAEAPERVTDLFSNFPNFVLAWRIGSSENLSVGR